MEVPGDGSQGTILIIMDFELYFNTAQKSFYHVRPYNITQTLFCPLAGRAGGEVHGGQCGRRNPARRSNRPVLCTATHPLPACRLSHHPQSLFIRCMCTSFLGVCITSFLTRSSALQALPYTSYLRRVHLHNVPYVFTSH